jgi:hypothetical protein
MTSADAGTAPAVDDCNSQGQATNAANFVFRAVMTGLDTSATPGIVNTLSNSWLSVGTVLWNSSNDDGSH